MANVIIKSSSGADITSRYDIIQSGDSITATRKVDDKMVILKDSDIISDSMHKINYNFELIENREDVNDYKLVKYSKQINDEIEKLRDRVDMNNTILSNSIDRLSGEISSSGSSADIQAKVNNAIMNANSLISDMVSSLAGQQISSALGSYVKTSELTSRLSGYITSDALGNYVTRDELPDGTVDYVSSTAFDAFKADVASRSASASRIVSNNKLYRIDGCLVYNSNGDKPVSHVSGQKSTYETVEQVYEAIKDTIDPPNPDRKGIDDPGVSERLIAFIESTFRTVASELSLFKQEVIDGQASFELVAAAAGDDEFGPQIAASIFGYADKDGSKLMLNADQITLSASHKLNVTTGTFTVNENDNNANFQLKGNGDVKVKGNITATSLTLESGAMNYVESIINSTVTDGISSNNTIKNALTNLINTVGTDNGWGNNDPETPDEYNDEWLTRAFNKTFSAGGLLLTGNVFVGDSNGNITAGMMGASGNTNDIRFFAGSDSTSTSSAPFRVYEDGHLYASDAEISGNVKANKFEAYGDTETFDSYDGGETIVSWNVTRQTEMNGNQFGISSICTNDSTTGNQVSSLYITILDEYEVTQNDDPVLYSLADDYDDGENSGKRLHGIPVLCFNYKGTKFVMTPGSWKGSAVSAVNTSDIYFLEESDKIYNSLVFSNNQVYYEKHTASGKDYYIYNKKYKDYIITTSDAKLYKFGYSYGNAQNEQELRAILNSYNLLRPNLYGVNVDSNYIFNSSNPSNITNETAQACRNNLYTGNTYKKFSYDSPKQWFNEPGQIDPSALNAKIVEAIVDIFRNPNDTFGNGDGWDRGNTDIANGGGVINAMSNIEPFEADNVIGRIERSYSGAYKEQYSNGAKVDAQNPTAYVDCKYFIFIDYPYPSNMYDGSVPSVTVEWDRGSYTSSETFYVSDVHITVQFGIYAEGLTSDVPSKLENLTKTTEFSDIYKNVYIHIDVYGQSSGLQTIKLTQFETYLS